LYNAGLAMSYERPNIERLTPYTPGEQPRHPRLVKLNTNENPYPPAQAVLDAIRDVSADSLRRYPPPLADAFRDTVQQVLGVPAGQVIATNGGDELLRMAVSVFCPPSGDHGRGGIGVAEPSYSLYPVLAEIHDTPVTRVPLRDDWSLPDDFAAKVLSAGCRLVLVVNPHAPSGHLESAARLEQLARDLSGRAVLLIDEAYTNFATANALALLRPQAGLDNVLILRTLSKGYSLAGLRFGFGLGSAGVIEALHKARDSYNVDILAQAAATAALQAREHAQGTWQRVIDERARVTAALRQRGFSLPDSQSNFVLAAPPAGRPDARATYESLKQQGIFVRYFDQDRLRDKLRITIGTPQQNDALLAALDALGGQ
jgi:histidinol-phosphate aminotransferase